MIFAAKDIRYDSDTKTMVAMFHGLNEPPRTVMVQGKRQARVFEHKFSTTVSFTWNQAPLPAGECHIYKYIDKDFPLEYRLELYEDKSAMNDRWKTLCKARF